jgi:hypothetical protein
MAYVIYGLPHILPSPLLIVQINIFLDKCRKGDGDLGLQKMIYSHSVQRWDFTQENTDQGDIHIYYILHRITSEALASN